MESMVPDKLSSLSVFFPAYNEEPNLESLIQKAEEEIPRFAKEYELIVVDDGSTDGTKRLVKRLQKSSPHLRIVSHGKNRGYGAALKTGIASARYDWIFFTDADLQFDMAELISFLPYTKQYKVIIGWRTSRAEGAQRALNARIFKAYIDILYRLHVRDIDCAFKLLLRETVQAVPLESEGAFTTAELLYKLKKQGVRFQEVPVSHYPRFRGNPTGAQFRVILKACWESLSLYLRMKRQALLQRVPESHRKLE